MEAYIKGIGIISPQKTIDTADFLSEIVEHNSNLLRAIEPPYLEYLHPNVARRMAKIIKMSVAASVICMDDAGLEMPDAIITGTATGCLENSEKFLLDIILNDEQFLSPTSFIQSTNNSVTAQIALHLNCMNYNFTYVHKGFSFENALIDALMLLQESDAKNILVGGHDQITETHYKVCDRIGYWKREIVPTMELRHSRTAGTIAGEGAAFFVLGNEEGQNCYAKLCAIKTIYKPQSRDEIENKITKFLSKKNLSPNDVDVVIYGINGDARFDNTYYDLQKNYFKNSTSACFKHLCGEYQTSGSFALWLAAKILKTQVIPKAVLIDEPLRSRFKNILIYNNFLNVNHSLYLLSGVH